MSIGTGWLGWTEQEVNNTLMPVIEQAYKAKRDMLEQVLKAFGGESAPAHNVASRPMSMNLFDALFGKGRAP